jgi:hypothetical protein
VKWWRSSPVRGCGALTVRFCTNRVVTPFSGRHLDVPRPSIEPGMRTGRRSCRRFVPVGCPPRLAHLLSFAHPESKPRTNQERTVYRWSRTAFKSAEPSRRPLQQQKSRSGKRQLLCRDEVPIAQLRAGYHGRIGAQLLTDRGNHGLAPTHRHTGAIEAHSVVGIDHPAEKIRCFLIPACAAWSRRRRYRREAFEIPPKRVAEGSVASLCCRLGGVETVAWQDSDKQPGFGKISPSKAGSSPLR